MSNERSIGCPFGAESDNKKPVSVAQAISSLLSITLLGGDLAKIKRAHRQLGDFNEGDIQPFGLGDVLPRVRFIVDPGEAKTILSDGDSGVFLDHLVAPYFQKGPIAGGHYSALERAEGRQEAFKVVKKLTERLPRADLDKIFYEELGDKNKKTLCHQDLEAIVFHLISHLLDLDKGSNFDLFKEAMMESFYAITHTTSVITSLVSSSRVKKRASFIEKYIKNSGVDHDLDRILEVLFMGTGGMATMLGWIIVSSRGDFSDKNIKEAVKRYPPGALLDRSVLDSETGRIREILLVSILEANDSMADSNYGLSFGAGKRVCPARNFSISTMKYLLNYISENYTLSNFISPKVKPNSLPMRVDGDMCSMVLNSQK